MLLPYRHRHKSHCRLVVATRNHPVDFDGISPAMRRVQTPMTCFNNLGRSSGYSPRVDTKCSITKNPYINPHNLHQSVSGTLITTSDKISKQNNHYFLSCAVVKIWTSM